MFHIVSEIPYLPDSQKKNNGETVGHAPKFLTRLILVFLKNGGKLHITMTGPRGIPLI